MNIYISYSRIKDVRQCSDIKEIGAEISKEVRDYRSFDNQQQQPLRRIRREDETPARCEVILCMCEGVSRRSLCVRNMRPMQMELLSPGGIAGARLAAS